jgi:glycosyltransferase involved in cell wall biosynthesis
MVGMDDVIDKAVPTPPKVSVVMTFYKSEEFLENAIQSILSQTFQDFELVIVSEYGNSIRSDEMINSFSDARIKVIKNKERLGLVRSYNLAIRESRGEYIALMSGDDISYPNRLAEQVAFLNNNEEIGVVGSTTMVRNEIDGRRYLAQREILPQVISWLFLFNMELADPSVMVRRKVLEEIGLFDPDYDYCEDYELFARAARHTKIANISQPLVEYRIHSASVTSEHNYVQRTKAMQVALREERELLGRAIDPKIAKTFLMPDPKDSVQSRINGYELIMELEQAYSKKEPLSEMTKIRIERDVIRRNMQLTALCTFKSPFASARIFFGSIAAHPRQIRNALVQYTKFMANRVLGTSM